jgi:hypothetical protein
MKPFHRGILCAAGAGLAGLVLGYATSPRNAARGVEFTSVTMGPGASKAASSSSTGRQPLLVSLPPEKFFDHALAVVLHGGKAETMSTLLELLADRSLPPVAADFYRNALVARLVHLGAAKELLDSRQFSTLDHQQVVVQVVRSLTETNADAALAVVKGLPVTERPQAVSAFLNELGQHDPKRGLALLEKDPAMRIGESSFLAGWAKVDPKAAAEEVFSEKADARGTDERMRKMSVIGAWAQDDPAAAWQWIASQPLNRRSSAQNSWLSVLAMTDPDAALEALATKPELNNIFNSTMAQWIGLAVANNIEEANAAVAKVAPGAMRTELIDGLARSLSGQPVEAIAWMKTLLPGEQTQALDGLFMSLGLSDPEAALDLASHQLDGAQRHAAIGSVVAGWALRDFDTAFQTMLQKLSPEDLPAALSTIFRYHPVGSAAEEVAQIDAIEKLAPSSRASVLRAKGEASTIVMKDELLARVAQLSPEDRAAFATGAMERSFEISDGMASQLIGMLPAEEQAKHADEIGRLMSRTDPAGAAVFLAGLPEGPQAAAKRDALNNVVRGWAYLQPEAATAFVGQMPTGETKDKASRALALELRNFDLDAATRVAGATTTPQVRGDLIGQLAGAWARVDPERGRAAMQPLLQSDEDRRHAAALFSQK